LIGQLDDVPTFQNEARFRDFRFCRHSSVFLSSSSFETAASAFASFTKRWKGESELFWFSFGMFPDYACRTWSWKPAFAASLPDKFIEE
jgi:hypothetical protein